MLPCGCCLHGFLVFKQLSIVSAAVLNGAAASSNASSISDDELQLHQAPGHGITQHIPNSSQSLR